MAIMNMEKSDDSKKRKLEQEPNVKSKVKKSKKPKLAKTIDNTANDASPQVKNERKEKEADKATVKLQLPAEDIAGRYPVLNDTDLVKRFLSVPMNNNQKGRIRQTLRQGVKGANDELLPDVIYGKMQAIIKSSENLTESELRKLRLLYNMLNNATKSGVTETKEKKKKKSKKNKKAGKNNASEGNDKKDVKTESNGTDTEKNKMDTDDKSLNKEDNDIENGDSADKKDKIKGPKRYVVFIGNLKPDIEKEKLLSHFKEISDHIVDVRLPKREEGKRSSIAYLELKDEHSYELALSKHHTMLANKRINVLYTTQKNTKISKSEAKGTAAKLVALQKSGKLIGSVPLNKKRSHRRNIAKRAMAKAAASDK